MPKAQFASEGDFVGFVGGKRDLLLRPFPYLHKRLGIALEAFTSWRQPGARLVPNEKYLVEFHFQRSYSGADGGLGQVQALGGRNEASAFSHHQKGLSKVDVHRLI